MVERERKNESPKSGRKFGNGRVGGKAGVIFARVFGRGVKEVRAGQMQVRGFLCLFNPCNNRVPIAE